MIVPTARSPPLPTPQAIAAFEEAVASMKVGGALPAPRGASARRRQAHTNARMQTHTCETTRLPEPSRIGPCLLFPPPGIRRVEVPGSRPELGYALNRAERFTGELLSPDLKIFK